jgi:hypothetical protein
MRTYLLFHQKRTPFSYGKVEREGGKMEEEEEPSAALSLATAEVRASNLLDESDQRVSSSSIRNRIPIVR